MYRLYNHLPKGQQIQVWLYRYGYYIMENLQGKHIDLNQQFELIRQSPGVSLFNSVRSTESYQGTTLLYKYYDE